MNEIIIDELIKIGYILALRIQDENVSDEVSEGVSIIEIDNRYPEKLAAISGLIEAIKK